MSCFIILTITVLLKCWLGHEIVPLSVEVCVFVFELMQSRLPLKHKHENLCWTRITVCSLELMPQQYSNKARGKKAPYFMPIVILDSSIFATISC